MPIILCMASMEIIQTCWSSDRVAVSWTRLCALMFGFSNVDMKCAFIYAFSTKTGALLDVAMLTLRTLESHSCCSDVDIDSAGVFQ